MLKFLRRLFGHRTAPRAVPVLWSETTPPVDDHVWVGMQEPTTGEWFWRCDLCGSEKREWGYVLTQEQAVARRADPYAQQFDAFMAASPHDREVELAKQHGTYRTSHVRRHHKGHK